MPIGNWSLEWLNHNSQRSYPITADASRRDDTGTFLIPNDFIVSLYFPVHWGLNVEPGKFFILKIIIFSTGYQVILGYAGAAGDLEVASALIPKATHIQNRTYNLVGIGDFYGSRGTIVIGNLDHLEDEPAGEFVFDLAGSRLEPEAIRPNVRGLSSVVFQNGSEKSPELTGHIRIRAGRNMRFRVVQEAGEDPLVWVDAIEGAGLTADCVCDEGMAQPIRTINGIPPDGAGNFRFRGNDCLEVTDGQNGLTLQDVCSEPCCGCTELEAITSALESFGERAVTLENFLVSLEARASQMDQVVLGSKLGDRGCAPAAECE